MRLITIILLFVSGITYSQSSTELVYASISECKEDCYIEADLILKSLTNDTLKVKAGVNLNCCANFGVNYNLNKGVLNLVVFPEADENDVVAICTCNCYYELEYLIKNVTDIPEIVLINGETFIENREDAGWVFIDESIPKN